MKTKNNSDVIKGAVEIAQDIYDKVGGLEPMLSVDFKWAVDFTGKKKTVESRIGLFLSNDKMLEDRFEISGRLGFVAAVLSRLGLTSDPENILFVSEAWMGSDPSTRPSDDPKRKEVVIVATMDGDAKIHAQSYEILSSYKETQGGHVYIQKQIDKNPVGDQDIPNKVESSLLSSFWEIYKHTLGEMDRAPEIYERFKEVVAVNPVGAIETVFRASMDKYGPGNLHTNQTSYEKND